MTISMYAITVPVFTRYLKNLDALLDKAIAYEAEKKLKPEVLAASRLFPDMLPLSFQVQSTADRVKFTLARLTGKTPPAWDDTEKTLPELKERIKKALDYAETFTEAELDGTETKTLELTYRGNTHTVNALEHVTLNAVPQVFFHVTTAYNILRENGVVIGKRDFTGL